MSGHRIGAITRRLLQGFRRDRRTLAMMIVKKIRSSTAAPVPSSMPHSRWRGARERHAIATTSALSPDKRTLIQMIFERFTQNCG